MKTTAMALRSDTIGPHHSVLFVASSLSLSPAPAFHRDTGNRLRQRARSSMSSTPFSPAYLMRASARQRDDTRRSWYRGQRIMPASSLVWRIDALCYRRRLSSAALRSCSDLRFGLSHLGRQGRSKSDDQMTATRNLANDVTALFRASIVFLMSAPVKIICVGIQTYARRPGAGAALAIYLLSTRLRELISSTASTRRSRSERTRDCMAQTDFRRQPRSARAVDGYSDPRNASFRRLSLSRPSPTAMPGDIIITSTPTAGIRSPPWRQ